MDERVYRTLDELEYEHFRDHPEEIDLYLRTIFEEYGEHGITAALLASLRVIARVMGVTEMAEQIGMTRQGLQKALSSRGNPRLENINAILRAMGYRLVPQKIEEDSAPGKESAKRGGRVTRKVGTSGSTKPNGKARVLK